MAEFWPHIRVLAHFFNQTFFELTRMDLQVQVPSITPRERDALMLLAQGWGRGDAANILSITENTFRGHLESARKKLGTSHIHQTIAVAASRGLIFA